jgi:DNA anti-recombination protein RmuC
MQILYLLGQMFSWAPERRVATVLNVLMFVALIATIVSLHRANHRLKGEEDQLKLFERDMNRMGDAPNPDAVIPGVAVDSLLGERLRTCFRLRSIGADIDGDALNAVAVARLDDQMALASGTLALALMMGLLGTVLGLSTAVYNAISLLGDQAGLESAIGVITRILDGLATAFSTTLMGVLVTITAGITQRIVSRRQGRCVTGLELVSQLHVYPHYRTSASLALAQSATKLSRIEENLVAALTTLTEQMAEQGNMVVATVGQALSDLTGHLTTTGTEYLNVLTAIHQQTTQLVGTSPERIQPLIHSVTAMQGVARAAQEATEGLNRTVPDLRAAIASEVAEQTRSLQMMLDEQRTALTATMSGHRDSIVGAQERANETMNRQQVQLQQLHAEVSARLAGVAEAAVHELTGAVAAASGSFGKMAPQLAETIALQIDQQSRDLQVVLRDNQAAFTAQLNDHANALGRLSSQQADLLGTRTAEAFVRLETAIKNSTEALGRDTRATGDAASALAVATTSSAEATKALAPVVKQLVGYVERLDDSTRHRTSSSNVGALGAPLSTHEDDGRRGSLFDRIRRPGG